MYSTVSQSTPKPLTAMQTAPFNLFTHNGCITIQSPSGEHRTFQIRTQPKDATFKPGTRILALLAGPDNANDYKGFAFVDSPETSKNPTVHLWSRYRDNPTFQAYAKLLLYPQHYTQKGMQYHAETVCRVCNRKLTTPESIESGIGPKCSGRA